MQKPRLYVLISFGPTEDGLCSLSFRYGRLERELCLNLREPGQLLKDELKDAQTFSNYCIARSFFNLERYSDIEMGVIKNITCDMETHGLFTNMLKKSIKGDLKELVKVRWNAL